VKNTTLPNHSNNVLEPTLGSTSPQYDNYKNALITGVTPAQWMFSLQKWILFPGLVGLKSDGQTNQNRKQQKLANHIARI